MLGKFVSKDRFSLAIREHQATAVCVIENEVTEAGSMRHHTSTWISSSG